jgi:DNA uptake protein ComE-like DNA-binding protein
LLLGFSPRQAAAIENYRNRGGFRTAEQFLRLSIVSNHQHLLPYIRIAQRHPSAPAAQSSATADTAAVRRSVAAAQFIRPVDINSADTSELKSLPGIGTYLAQRIVEYRRKLGGYTNLEQLCEIKYFDHEKLTLLQNRLTVDPSRVTKIPLTAEGAELLRFHPYGGAYMARGIARQIKYNGATPTTLDNLVQNNILTPQQAEKLREYIVE